MIFWMLTYAKSVVYSKISSEPGDSPSCLFFSLGSLVVERGPGRPPIPNHQAANRAEAPPGGLSLTAQQRQSTLAQLQMQVTLSGQSVLLIN